MTSKKENLITDAIGLVGFAALAKACKVTPQAVRRWGRNGRLPRTDITGETDYARQIAKATRGRITRRALLQLTRHGLTSE